MANSKTYLSHLLQNTGITPACSEEERAASADIARIFSDHGFQPEVQEFSATSTPRTVRAVLGIAAFAGAVLMGVGGAIGVVGLLLAVAAAVIFTLERTGKPVFSQLGAGGLSQNVIAYHQASGPLASPRNRPVVVVAHYDSPRADLLSEPPYSSYRPLLVRALPVAILVPAILGVVRVLPLPGAAKVVLWIVAIVAALVPLANAVAIIANRFVLPYTSGAVCNKSSVAAMLGVMDAVAPFRGRVEFPDDRPADEYFAEQRRLAEEAAAAAAAYAGSGYGDGADEPAADGEAPEVAHLSLVEGSLDEDGGDGEDSEPAPAPAAAAAIPADGTAAMPAIPAAEGTASMPAIPAAGGTAALPLDRLAAAEGSPVSADGTASLPALSGDGAAPRPAEPEPSEPAPAAADDEPAVEAPAAAPEREEAAEPAPAGALEPDASEVAPAGPRAVRYGAEVIHALGMMPSTCKIVYERPAVAPVAAVEDEPAPAAPAAFDEDAGDVAPAPAVEPTAVPVPEPPVEPEVSSEPQPDLTDESAAPEGPDPLAVPADAGATGEEAPAELDEETPVEDEIDDLDVPMEAEYEVIGDDGDGDAGDAPEPSDEGDAAAGEAPADSPDAPQTERSSADSSLSLPAFANLDAAPDDGGAASAGEAALDSTVAVEIEPGGRTQAFAPQADAPEAQADAGGSTVAMPVQRPVAPESAPQQPVPETVDSLMAQISASVAPTPQPTPRRRLVNVPSVSGPSRAAAPASPVADRSSLFDLPDPSVTPVDPFAVSPEPAAPAAEEPVSPQSRFTVIPGTAPAAAPASEPVPTISAPAPASPSEGSAKKKGRGLSGLFGRRKRQDDDSMSEWLGVDDDFNAKESGHEIGSWDNFEDDGWKGGATGPEGVGDDELREAATALGDDELLGHDIWFVATGASECGNAGIKAFLDTHRDKLRGVFLINLESVGAGEVAMVASEGAERPLKGDKRIMNLVTRVSSDFHHEYGAVDMPYVTTDAHVAMEMSLRSLTLAGIDGPAFACARSLTDLPQNVDTDNVAMVADVVTEVIRRS